MNTSERQANSPVQRRGFFQFILSMERRFRKDDALMMAAALSYTSLLSFVPLLTIGLAILAAFPAFASVRIELQSELLRMLVPEVARQVRDVTESLIQNAGNLTAIGIIGLAVTAVLLLVTIEDALNRIFRVALPRTPMSRLLVYWTVVTLGPLLLAASLSVSDWLFPKLLMAADQEDWSMLSSLSTLFHFSMKLALFSLLYLAVPNRPVSPVSALCGGLLAALLIALIRRTFSIYVDDFHAYQSVWGALAALPILLFWMYLVWVAVLVGAVFTASLLDADDA
jgi:membrane protein